MTTSRSPDLWRDANFRWLMAGSAISLLGDQFTLLALPWLVLRTTGDTAALGLVLAAVGLPRAVFMLAGGAVVDRFSPRRVMLWTKYVNSALLAVLALGVHGAWLGLPALYALALALGVSSAFALPSGTSILPQVLPPARLAAANGMLMGLRQLSMFVGPLAAGLLIAGFGDAKGGVGPQQDGMALAFAFDAASFALSAFTLSRVRAITGLARPAPQRLWQAMAEGIAAVWRDAPLRACFGYWAAVAVLVLGPLQIALPVLASSRAELGASALGTLLAAHGGGTLLGMVLSGLPVLARVGTLGTRMLLADVAIGLLFMPLGAVHGVAGGAVLMGVIGVLGGFMQVAVFTWIQRRVAPALLGRTMALFMFIFMGLAPLAASATGWLLQLVPAATLFIGCGALLVLSAALAWLLTPLSRIDHAPAARAPA